MKLKLYHYWRSSSSWRVRMALAHRKIPVEYVHINIVTDEVESPAYLQKNPMGYVPALEISDGKKTQVLAESLAIIQWLEETQPGLSLFPKDSFLKAKVWQASELINAAIQPLQNNGVLDVLTEFFGESGTQAKLKWAALWNRRGLAAYEELTRPHRGKWSFGDSLTVADLCLIPQIYSAKRFNVEPSEFQPLFDLYERALQLDFVQATLPEVFQPGQPGQPTQLKT